MVENQAIPLLISLIVLSIAFYVLLSFRHRASTWRWAMRLVQTILEYWLKNH